MAETSLCSGMAEVNITAMKETLRVQQQLLQKLYAELEEERECSATAAREVLDTMLRLQSEKATVEMEASHYMRMAEEKISHAETALGILEELLYQKEIEIAFLEFQLQAYGHKLVSMGCDLTSMEYKFLENDQHNAESGQESILRKLNSFPVIHLNNMTASPSPVLDVDIPSIIEESTFQRNFPQTLDVGEYARESACGILGSYGSQIKRLDEKEKVISDFKCEGEKCEIFSQANAKITSCGHIDWLLPIDSDEVNHCETVHARDVFEVPTTGHKARKCAEKGEEELNSEVENRLRKPDLVPMGMVESNVKIEPDNKKIKDKLSTKDDINVFNPIGMAAIIDLRKDGMSTDCCNVQDEFQKVYQRIERLERDRIGIRQEIVEEVDKEEQLRLLKDIHSQLDSIQSEMRSWNTKNAPRNDDVCLDPLQEVRYAFVFFALSFSGNKFSTIHMYLFILSLSQIEEIILFLE